MAIDESAYLAMGEYESNPDLLSGVLEQLRGLTEETEGTDHELLDRYRQASSVVLDFFEKLEEYAEFEDAPHLTGLEGAPISMRIIRSISGYPDLARANRGVEALLKEAYAARDRWEADFWDLSSALDKPNEKQG